MKKLDTGPISCEMYNGIGGETGQTPSGFSLTSLINPFVLLIEVPFPLGSTTLDPPLHSPPESPPGSLLP